MAIYLDSLGGTTDLFFLNILDFTKNVSVSRVVSPYSAVGTIEQGECTE